MHTRKVSNYPNIKFTSDKGRSILVLISILHDFELLTDGEASVIYGQISNLHYDLRKKKQNRITTNENRSLTKG